jgi:CRP-like cAMP-binding protein
MAELHPRVLRRMLALRRFPVLADAELSELALVAENVTESTLAAGAVVASAGAQLPALHLVVSGEIATLATTWGAGQVFGGLEVLARRPVRERAVTTCETTTLQLLASDAMEVLEDSFGVLRAVLRGLASHTPPVAPRVPMPPGSAVRPLGLVERLMALRKLAAFAGAPLDALVALAHAAEELEPAAGTRIACAGERGGALYVVLAGSLRAARDGQAQALGRGEVIGLIEVLGGLAHAASVEAGEGARVLAVAAASLFDVLEDYTDFGRSIVAALAGALWDGLRAQPPDA